MVVPVPDQLEYISDANGVTKVFPYPKRFLQKDEVVVALRDADGVDAIQTLNIDYTIAGSSWPNGGDVVFNIAPTTGYKVVLYRMTQAKQTVDLANNQRNDAPSVERQLDRLTMAIQDRGHRTDSAWFGLLAEIIARKAGDAALNSRVDKEIIDRENGDKAVASLVGQAGDIEVPFYDTRLAVTFANIKATINAIRTGGYAAPGDGGDALYRRVWSEPAHAGKVRSLDRFLPNSSVDQINGGWWELATGTIRSSSGVPLSEAQVQSGLQDEIAEETTSRQTAVLQEATARQAAISQEAITRQAAIADLSTRVEGASAGLVQAATWAALNSIVGSRAGQPGRVSATDTGGHTDPVVGGTVNNAGEYAWSVSPAGWRRIGDTRRTDAELFSQRGQIPAGSNLNEFLELGTYLGAAGGYVMLPTGFTRSFFLTNEAAGSATGTGVSRYVKQTLTDLNNLGFVRNQWVRTVDRQNVPATDIWANMRQVHAVNLTDSYQYRGAVGNVSYNTLLSDGLYVATGGMTDAPSGAPVGALIKVRRFGNFIVQEITGITDPTTGWMRVIQNTTVFNAWIVFGGSGSGGDGSFNGKKIVCFGDSITENGNYPLLLGLRLGADTTNGGFGGCRMAVHSIPQYDPMSMYRISEYMRDNSWSILTSAAQTLFEFNADDNRPNAAALAATDWAAVDYAVIFYGTNDFTANIPIGLPTDSTPATFKGAINVTIQNILTSHPHIKLMFVTPLWRNVAETPNSNGAVLSDFADAIIERAQAYQIEVMDMYRGCGINALTTATYLSDGTHPHPGFGYKHVADKISAALGARF